MNWVTRVDCHVDRTACAWLIRRYIDPDATFQFVDDPSRLPPDATPFDIPGHPFSHHGPDCTFEVLLQHHGMTDAGLAALAHVVHEADVEDDRFDAPEAVGLDAIVRGMGRIMDDDALLDATLPVYDGLLAQLRA